MPDSVFLDSNVILCLYSEDEADKQQAAERILKSDDVLIISRQVVNEVCNIMLQKFAVDVSSVKEVTRELDSVMKIVELDAQTTVQAQDIKQRYQFSFWDSMVIASALIDNCQILYSEDPQHGQVIDGKLKIVNPFTQ